MHKISYHEVIFKNDGNGQTSSFNIKNGHFVQKHPFLLLTTANLYNIKNYIK
jgi:hypothetical protein